MATKIEFYQQLREHIPDEAARLIAEEARVESELATRNDLREAIHGVEMSIERLRTSFFRWQLIFFVPLWAGVYASLVALILKH